MLAIANWAAHRPGRILLALTLLGLNSFTPVAWAEEPIPSAAARFAAHSQERYVVAQQRLRAEPTNAMAAWEFGRASFDRAEYATNDTERALLAVAGIAACRRVLAGDPESAPAHYYLSMNLGQLARTKTLGALRIVDEMEREFKAARGLDERFDFAGPDRFLGQLYLQAPATISVGNRTKARKHLERAVELCPDYPENRLNLAEAYYGWGDKNWRRELAALEKLWPQARTNFTGPVWEAFWLDWQQRRDKLRRLAGDAVTPAPSPSSRSGQIAH
jgi:tetratricopeptide (TPR) repeat protein